MSYTRNQFTLPAVPRPILVPFVETVAFLFGSVMEKSGRHVRTKLDGSSVVIKESDVKDENKVRHALSSFLSNIKMKIETIRIWPQEKVKDAFNEAHPSYQVVLIME
jgi:hypothetical protein